VGDRILVLGGAGMAGHKLWQVLAGRGHEAFATVRGALAGPAAAVLARRQVIEHVDAATDDGLARAFAAARPAVMVNAAGIVKQRPEAAGAAGIAVNALLPHRLAALCGAGGVRLVHLSTDCVFSGTRAGGGYREDDIPDPQDRYGLAKRLGEVEGPGTLTLRTSMVGRELAGGHGLLEWLRSRRGGEAPGWRRAVFSGVTTETLAEAVADIVEKHTGLEGIHHLAGPRTDKASLLELLSRRLTLHVRIVPEDGPAVDRSLDGSRFGALTGWQAPGWEAMAERLAADPTPYPDRP
jgi:dTDP-4-dehydrorhamnose reductase